MKPEVMQRRARAEQLARQGIPNPQIVKLLRKEFQCCERTAWRDVREVAPKDSFRSRKAKLTELTEATVFEPETYAAIGESLGSVTELDNHRWSMVSHCRAQAAQWETKRNLWLRNGEAKAPTAESEAAKADTRLLFLAMRADSQAIAWHEHAAKISHMDKISPDRGLTDPEIRRIVIAQLLPLLPSIEEELIEELQKGILRAHELRAAAMETANTEDLPI